MRNNQYWTIISSYLDAACELAKVDKGSGNRDCKKIKIKKWNLLLICWSS